LNNEKDKCSFSLLKIQQKNITEKEKESSKKSRNFVKENKIILKKESFHNKTKTKKDSTKENNN
jgi:hypothetical protein